MQNRVLLFGYVACLMLCACSRSDEGTVARVYDVRLSTEDIQRMQPDYGEGDSITVHQAIVDAWVEKQAMVHLAEQQLTSREKNFDRELREYYESLLADAYEEKEVEKRLDRNIPESELKSYYDQHKSDFEMHKNIIQINYAKFPIGHPDIETARRLLDKGKSRNRAEQEKLEKICYNGAENTYLESNWIVFDDILKEIPLNPYNQELFLKQNESLELKDSVSVYLVRFLDYKINETYSPFENEKEHIKKILWDRQRVSLRQQIRREAVEKAKKEHEITTKFDQ